MGGRGGSEDLGQTSHARWEGAIPGGVGERECVLKNRERERFGKVFKNSMVL